MNAYHNLAASYDSLTMDVDYDGVVAFYLSILKKESAEPRTAVDMSEEMLCVAQQKAESLTNRPQFVCQKLQELKLPRGVDLAVCALDSIDYIVNPADCQKAMERVYKALNPGGIFIFDVNTPEKLKAMDGQVFLDENEDTFCVWRGEFDPKTNICSYGMDLFQRQGSLWSRSFEEHREYAYSQQQLVGYLKTAGFTGIEVFGDRRMESPNETDLRIYLKARKGRIK